MITEALRDYVALDSYIVMPNHFHGVLWLTQDEDGNRDRRVPLPAERFGGPIPSSLPTIIRSFKSAVTRRINQLDGTSGRLICQHNYYEHVIRKEESLEEIRQYIININNPARWELDSLYSQEQQR